MPEHTTDNKNKTNTKRLNRLRSQFSFRSTEWKRNKKLSNWKVKWDAQLITFNGLFCAAFFSLSPSLLLFLRLSVNSKTIYRLRFNCSTDLYSHLLNLFSVSLHFFEKKKSFDLESLQLVRQNAIAYCHRLWNRIVHNCAIAQVTRMQFSFFLHLLIISAQNSMVWLIFTIGQIYIVFGNTRTWFFGKNKSNLLHTGLILFGY